MSFATCDRRRNAGAGNFQLNPPGHSSLGEFPRHSLGQYRHGYRRFARFLNLPKLLATIGKPYRLHNTKRLLRII
jgi:hypothetical protein